MIPITPVMPLIPGPLSNAKDLSLPDNTSGQPQIGQALLDWFRPMVIGVVTQTPQDGGDSAEIERLDGTVKEVVREIRTSGCLNLGKGAKLDIQPGGNRAWQNAMLWTTPEFNQPANTLIIVAGVRYRVFKPYDYSANGFVQYELTQDYAPNLSALASQ